MLLLVVIRCFSAVSHLHPYNFVSACDIDNSSACFEQLICLLQNKVSGFLVVHTFKHRLSQINVIVVSNYLFLGLRK